MKNMKYVKVMNGTTSNANSKLEYKINEINIAENWNPEKENPEEMGGFNFSTENKVLRWLLRGNTIYDVEIPKDAEVIECESKSAPHGVFRTNKIIIKNKRQITDDLATELYIKSELPWKSYIQILSYLAASDFKNVSNKIVEDKINSKNAKEALDIYENFLKIKMDPMPEFYIEILNRIKEKIIEL